MEKIKSKYDNDTIKSTLMNFMKGKLSSDLYLDSYLFGYLCECYRKPVNEKLHTLRYYHNIDHIIDGINNLVTVFEFDSDDNSDLSGEFVFAWLFHDCVYKVPCSANGNEEDSANKALEVLETSPLDLKRIKDLILYTKHDVNPPIEDYEANLIVELDLIGLASDSKEFKENSEKIRKEYSYYTDEEYGKGRLAFFKDFLHLKDGKIFNLVPYTHSYNRRALDSYNHSALVNINEEMKYLKELYKSPK